MRGAVTPTVLAMALLPHAPPPSHTTPAASAAWHPE